MSLLVVLVASSLVAGAFDMPEASVDQGDAQADALGVPRGIHLSFSQDPATTMTVTWFTNGADDPGSLVEYGEDPEELDRLVEGTAHAVPEQDDILVHEATMTGLQPGVAFYYRVGSESAWSDVWSSHTQGEAGEPYRIVLFADQGVSDPASAVTQDMLDLDPKPDLILIAGDLAYAENDHLRWDTWYDMNEPLFATTPMMSSIGNHEGYSSFGSEAYTSRVSLPSNEVYYSFEYGGIHYLVLQSTTAHAVTEGIFEDMVEFAHQDLQEAVKRRADGRIDYIAILQHHPIYSNHHSPERQFNTGLMAWQEALIEPYMVDLLLVGHNHHYERSFPMVASVPTTLERTHYEDPVGWIQVVSGGAGRSLYNFQHPDDFWPHSAQHARKHHFVTIDVDGDTLQFQAISAGFGVNDVLDEFTLGRGVVPGPAFNLAAGFAQPTSPFLLHEHHIHHG